MDIRKIILFAWLLPFAGCVDDFDLEPRVPESGIVAISHMRPDAPLTVYISESRDPSNIEEFEYLENATALLAFPGGRDTLDMQSGGGANRPFYFTEHMPQPGMAYQLKVEVPGKRMIIAEDSIPMAPDFTRLNTTAFGDDDDQRQWVSFELEFNDDPRSEDYYHIYVYRMILRDGMPQPVHESMRCLAIQEGDHRNVTQLEHESGLLLNDRYFNGEKVQYHLRFETRSVVDNDTEDFNRYIVELRRVSPNYYKYHESLARQFQSGTDKFSEPVVIFSNVESGHGIFAGFNPMIRSKKFK